MKKISRALLALTPVYLTACATTSNPVPHNWAYDVQTAETRDAHQRLADHYEDVARMMDTDATEERAMLDKYQTRPDIYGKRILDLRARAEMMVRDFEKAADDSRKMAEYHRQLAQEQSR